MDCIFCKIIAKQIPADIVYEDKDYLAFLDIHPQSSGQTLIIPKKHYRWVWDLPVQAGMPNIGSYFEVAQKIALAQRKAFSVELIRSNVYGEEVPHAHISMFIDIKNNKGDKMDFKGNMEKIKENLNPPL
ncbi:MAG: HIT family protein [Patescibacteria group bacterium]